MNEQIRPLILDSSEFGRKCKPIFDEFVRTLRKKTMLGEDEDRSLVTPTDFSFVLNEAINVWSRPQSNTWGFLTSGLSARTTVDVRRKLVKVGAEAAELLQTHKAVLIGGLRVAIVVDPCCFRYEVRLVLPFQ